jgi:hypothetical protein
LQGGSAGHREHWSQHNFDGYGAKLGNACPPDGSLTGHPRPEISLFNCTESVPWARGSCNSFQSSTMIYRGGSFGRALARAPTSRAETSFCRSPVVKLLLIIQVPDASDKRGVGLLFHPINRPQSSCPMSLGMWLTKKRTNGVRKPRSGCGSANANLPNGNSRRQSCRSGLELPQLAASSL